MTSLAERSEIVGFFSYSRDDDFDSGDALTRLRTRIQAELRTQLGRSRESLRLWQDAEAIAPGTLWESQIDAAVTQSVFFIPIVTPRVVASKYCGLEFDKFLERERELGREDLVFPILFVDVGELSDERIWRTNPILKAIGERQYVDWRDFRYEPESVAARKAVGQFCAKIVQALRKQTINDGKGVRWEANDNPSQERSPSSNVGAQSQQWPRRQAALSRAMIGWVGHFDEARLPIAGLAAYAVATTNSLGWAFAVPYWKSHDFSIFDWPPYVFLGSFGALFGMAIVLIYVVLGASSLGRMILSFLVTTVGWISAVCLFIALQSLLFNPDAESQIWSIGKKDLALCVSWLLWGAATIGGVAIMERGILTKRRIALVLGTSAGIGILFGLFHNEIAMVPALSVSQLFLATALFHGRKPKLPVPASPAESPNV